MSIIAAGTTTTTALSSTGNTDGTLQFQVNGTTASVTLNTLGAIGVGSTPAFGTSGQVLTSAGSTAAPAWTTPTAQTYPGSGIPNSTGSAWGTSYSTTGSGTVVALATSPSFTTPLLGTPTSGTLSNCTVDGTNAVGFLLIPQNIQAGNYTLVLADSGKHIYHALGAGSAAYTIPANGSVAFPIGTAITFVNMSATSISIAITTDTMYLSSTGSTGTRTLAQYGSATAMKLTSTTWLISGSALT
jgi:hypothetical protein